MKLLYTAHATAVGGRGGHVETDDKNLSLDLSTPGAGKGQTTNPEQLFACGYAACFGSAVEAVAKHKKVAIGEVSVTADVKLMQNDDGGYGIGAALTVSIAGMDKAQVKELVDAAHEVCPYSKATRGNIEVQLNAA